MKITHDLAALKWTVAGYTPNVCRLQKSFETGHTLLPDIGPMPARVPGSVQLALRKAGLLPDWNMGLNHRLCEWVEHLDWLYAAAIPDNWLVPGGRMYLRCEGLDGVGSVFVNDRQVGDFDNGFVPYLFDLAPGLKRRGTPCASCSCRRRGGWGRSAALPKCGT